MGTRVFSELFFRFIMLVALFAVFFTLYIVQNHKLEVVNRRILKAQQGIKELEVKKKKVDEFKAKNNELNRRIDIIFWKKTGPSHCMLWMRSQAPYRTGHGLMSSARRD